MRESIPKFLNGDQKLVVSLSDSGFGSDDLGRPVDFDNWCARMKHDVVLTVPIKRYFAVGARAGMSIPLYVVEDLFPETKLEVFLGAPAGATGYV